MEGVVKGKREGEIREGYNVGLLWMGREGEDAQHTRSTHNTHTAQPCAESITREGAGSTLTFPSVIRDEVQWSKRGV